MARALLAAWPVRTSRTSGSAMMSTQHVPPPHRRIRAGLRSPAGALKLLLAVIVAVAVLGGLPSLREPLAAVSPAYLYRKDAIKDFVQEYLLAKALADGIDPYLPINVLAVRYLGISLEETYPHPSPHPPPVAILSLPLTALDYPTAATAWLVTELICLVAAVYLLARTAGLQPTLMPSLAIVAASLAWFPVADELLLGQLMLPLLLILTLGRLALLKGRPVLGGTLLGCAALVKPITWPVLVVFAVMKEWRVLVAAAWVIGIGYTVAGWAMGPRRVVTYFTEVLPAAHDPFRGSNLSISAWGLGWRLFEGTGSPMPVHAWLTAPPLVESPVAARVVAAGLPALIFGVACWWAWKGSCLDGSLGVMICASLLVSPIAWWHYLVLIFIPVAQVAKWLACRRAGVTEGILALVVAVLLLPSRLAWEELALLIAGQTPVAHGGSVVPTGAALLTLAPALGVAALGCLVAMLAPGPRAASSAAGPTRSPKSEAQRATAERTP